MIRPVDRRQVLQAGAVEEEPHPGVPRDGSLLTGYGGKLAPPFTRIYIGGEQDVRGFEIWGISPIAFIPSEAPVNVLNDDGSRACRR